MINKYMMNIDMTKKIQYLVSQFSKQGVVTLLYHQLRLGLIRTF